MKQISVAMHSFSDIQEFVSISSRQTFEVTAGPEGQQINCKSLMAMLGLNFRRPVLVNVNCDDTEFLKFRRETARFLA